jgi:hypothetical protein
MNSGRKVLHFLVLAFTAFWLVATSRARRPARECFVPLAKPMTVTLGAPTTTSAAPSCGALDGLTEGSVLRARVQRSASAPQVSYEDLGTCWGYGVSELTGPADVSALRANEASPTYPNALFDLEGTFVSSASPTECAGDYRLVLQSARLIPGGSVVDPRRAGAGQAWRVTRLIRMNPGRNCPHVPPLPDNYCEDTFEVRSIGHGP